MKRPRPYPARTGVYVVRFLGPYIKIGFSKNIRSRLECLNAMHPVAGKLIAVVGRSRAGEQVMHGKCAPWRVHGEWFRDTPGLRRTIEASAMGMVTF